MAWSLLPLAVYLVHALALVGRIVSAIVQFAASFVFSPGAWFGVILVVVAALLFLVSGGIPLVGKRHDKKKDRDRAGSGSGGAGKSQAPAAVSSGRKRSAAPADDDDLSDVRDILKKHGIS
jgi:membrane protein implicated in regulation of membrane protease activity